MGRKTTLLEMPKAILQSEFGSRELWEGTLIVISVGKPSPSWHYIETGAHSESLERVHSLKRDSIHHSAKRFQRMCMPTSTNSRRQPHRSQPLVFSLPSQLPPPQDPPNSHGCYQLMSSSSRGDEAVNTDEIKARKVVPYGPHIRSTKDSI
jgi:hypothetical protein